jgi:hypothetical protein
MFLLFLFITTLLSTALIHVEDLVWNRFFGQQVGDVIFGEKTPAKYRYSLNIGIFLGADRKK